MDENECGKGKEIRVLRGNQVKSKVNQQEICLTNLAAVRHTLCLLHI